MLTTPTTELTYMMLLLHDQLISGHTRLVANMHRYDLFALAACSLYHTSEHILNLYIIFQLSDKRPDYFISLNTISKEFVLC